jgi:hypothetical protein
VVYGLVMRLSICFIFVYQSLGEFTIFEKKMGFGDDDMPAPPGGLVRQPSLGVCVPVVTPLGFAEQLAPVSPMPDSPLPSPLSSPSPIDHGDVKEFVPPLSPDHTAVKLSWGTAYIPKNQISEVVAIKLTAFHSNADKAQETDEFTLQFAPRDSINHIFNAVAEKFDVDNAAVRLAHHGIEMKRSDEQLRKSKIFMHPPFELLCVIDESQTMQNIRLVLDFESNILEYAFGKGHVGEKQMNWRNTVRADQTAYNLYVYEVCALETYITFEAVLDTWKPVRNAWIYYMRCLMNFNDGLGMLALFVRYMKPESMTKAWLAEGGAGEKWHKMVFKYCLQDFYGRWALIKYGLVCMLENMRRERLRSEWQAVRFQEILTYIFQDTSYYETNLSMNLIELIDNLVEEPKPAEQVANADDKPKEDKPSNNLPAANAEDGAQKAEKVAEEKAVVEKKEDANSEKKDNAENKPSEKKEEAAKPENKEPAEEKALLEKKEDVSLPNAAISEQKPEIVPNLAVAKDKEAMAVPEKKEEIEQKAIDIPIDAGKKDEVVEQKAVEKKENVPIDAGNVVPVPMQEDSIPAAVVEKAGDKPQGNPENAQPAEAPAAAPAQPEAIPQDILNALGDGADDAMIRKLLEEEQAMLMALQFGDDAMFGGGGLPVDDLPKSAAIKKVDSISADILSPKKVEIGIDLVKSDPIKSSQATWVPENPEALNQIKDSFRNCGSMTDLLCKSILDLEALLPRSFFKDNWQNSQDRKRFLEIMSYQKKKN